jgi:hypothetical protein
MSMSISDRFKMPEDNKTIRKIKKIICNTNIGSDERLFTGEYVGDFAIRYTAYLLSKRKAKAKKVILIFPN